MNNYFNVRVRINFLLILKYNKENVKMKKIVKNDFKKLATNYLLRDIQ